MRAHPCPPLGVDVSLGYLSTLKDRCQCLEDYAEHPRLSSQGWHSLWPLGRNLRSLFEVLVANPVVGFSCEATAHSSRSSGSIGDNGCCGDGGSSKRRE